MVTPFVSIPPTINGPVSPSTGKITWVTITYAVELGKAVMVGLSGVYLYMSIYDLERVV